MFGFCLLGASRLVARGIEDLGRPVASRAARSELADPGKSSLQVDHLDGGGWEVVPAYFTYINDDQMRKRDNSKPCDERHLSRTSRHLSTLSSLGWIRIANLVKSCLTLRMVA